MTARPVLFVDLSSNNPEPDLTAHYAAGRRLIGLKATEGTGYVWRRGLELADIWHRLGGRVVWYHFLTAGTGGREQASYFLAATRRHLARGDVLAADVEGQPETYRQWVRGEAADTLATFARTLDHDAPRFRGRRLRRWIYGPPYFLRDEGIRPMPGWGLWVADYRPSAPSLIPPGWTRYDAWQFTDRARNVPGCPSPVDQSEAEPAVLPRRLRPRQRHEARHLARTLGNNRDELTAGSRGLLQRLAAAIKRRLRHA